MEYGFSNLWYSGWVLVMYVVELEERGFEGVPCAKKSSDKEKKRLVKDKISCSNSRDRRTMNVLHSAFCFILQLE